MQRRGLLNKRSQRRIEQKATKFTKITSRQRKFVHNLCSTVIELRAFSRGFLSGEQGFTTSFSPVRPFADTPIRSPSVVAAMPRCLLLFKIRLGSAISENRSFFGRFFSHTTAPLPRCLRRYAPTPTRRYGRHLWLRLRCAKPLRLGVSFFKTKVLISSARSS